MVSSSAGVKEKDIEEIREVLKRVVERSKSQRKAIALIAVTVIVLLALTLFWLPLVPQAIDTCNNSIFDPGEEGIDCGGVCFKQCLSGGELSPEFQSPSSVTDIAVDSLDRIYVLDSGRHRLLVYSPELEYLRNVGEKNFVSGGSGEYEFITPTALAVSNNRVFVADRFNGRIQAFNEKLEFVATINEAQYGVHGRFSGLAHSNGLLAAASDVKDTVYLIRLNDMGSVLRIARELKKPSGVAFLDEKLLVTDTANHKVKVFDLQGNKLKEFGGLGNTKETFNYPTGIAVGNSLVAVADSGNNRVVVFDSSFNFVGVIPKDSSVESQLNTPKKVAIDSGGRFIVADSGNNRVVVFDSSFTFVKELKGISKGEYASYAFSPRYIRIDDSGKVFVSENERNQITVLDLSGNFLGKVGGVLGSNAYEFNEPRDLAIDTRGRLYVADKGNNRVVVFDEKQEQMATIGGKRGTGQYEFDDPRSVAVDSKGRVFIVDKGNSRVQVFDGSFKYLATIESNESFRFREPVPIAIDSEDNIYVADSKSNKIHVFNPEFEFERDIEIDNVVEMEGGLAFDSKGRLLVVDIEGHTVKLVSPQTGQIIKEIGGQGSGESEFDWPHGVAVAPNNDVYVVDLGNRRIQVFDSELNYKYSIDGGADHLIETAR